MPPIGHPQGSPGNNGDSIRAKAVIDAIVAIRTYLQSLELPDPNDEDAAVEIQKHLEHAKLGPSLTDLFEDDG